MDLIKEEFVLPSLGKIYDVQFDPHVTIRSMTVAEEMKRLTPSETPYKTMCDIVDACIVNKLPISSYDMCLGDYQFLLHKLRIVTYGSEYKLTLRCPDCGEMFNHAINLDELPVHEYTDELSELYTVNLPVSKDTVEIYF